MELRPPIRFAAQLYGSLHLVHDILGDGHAQPRSFYPVDAGIGLARKRIIDSLLEFFRHADASILHMDMGAHMPISQRGTLLIQAHGDGTAQGRELERVGKQIQQNLIQPHVVGIDSFRQNIANTDIETQFLRSDLRLHDAHQPFHDLTQGNDVDIEREPAALDLGHIQHIVDQSQQMPAGKRDFPQAVVNNGGILEIRRGDGRHAHDGVHGRTDVVTHIGQEFALGAVRPVRLMFRLPQRKHLPPRRPSIKEHHDQYRQQNQYAPQQRNKKPPVSQLRDYHVERPMRHDRHQKPLGRRHL